MRWRHAALVAGLLVAFGPAQAQAGEPEGSPQAEAENPPPDMQALRQRIKVLEDLAVKLQGDLEVLRAQARREGAGPGATLSDLGKKVDALSQEIARLRKIETPAAAGETVHGLAPGASKVYLAPSGFVFGGYGSALYQRFTRSRDNDTPSNALNQADLTEAFFYFGYRFNDRFVFNSSIGLEHALAGEGTGIGEAAVEFAYVDYQAGRKLGARGGLLLVPLGFLNEQHEPNLYLGARRPEVETRIIPSTWREVGGGVYGQAGPVEWRGYLTTSLDAFGFTEDEAIRGGRQQGSEARAADLGLSARVDWRPLGNPAHGDLLAGASGFTGKTDQNRPGFPPGRLSLWDLHAEYSWRGLRARALYALGLLSDAAEVSLAIDVTGTTAIFERMRGWYAEVGYDVFTQLKVENQHLTPFCRYEQLDTQDAVAPGFSRDPANDMTVKTCGINYEPIPGLVIKVDAQNYSNQVQTAVDQVNLGLGWAF